MLAGLSGIGRSNEGLDVPQMEMLLKRWLIIGYSIRHDVPGSRRDHMVGHKARNLGPLSAEQKAKAVESGDFAAADLVGL